MVMFLIAFNLQRSFLIHSSRKALKLNLLNNNHITFFFAQFICSIEDVHSTFIHLNVVQLIDSMSLFITVCLNKKYKEDSLTE